jgi:NAD(P)H dehydrogenase (quinone)
LAEKLALTIWGSWWIFRAIWNLLSEPPWEISRPAFVAVYGGSLSRQMNNHHCRRTYMHRRQFLRPGIVAVAAVLLLANSPTRAADSTSAVTVLIAYHSVSGNTEKMAQGISEGVKAVSGTKVTLKKVGDVVSEDLLLSDAVIVGSPVYVGNMSGEVKTFFDNWGRKFGLGTGTGKMRNKVGGAFATGGGVSSPTSTIRRS